MKVRLGCQKVRSVHWAVKKIPAQIEMMCDKGEIIVVISKLSFLPREQKNRISRGYCRDDRPSSICWARDLVQGLLVVRGRVNIVMEVGISE